MKESPDHRTERSTLSRRSMLAGAAGVGVAGLAWRGPLGRSLSVLGDATGVSGVASAAIAPATEPLLDAATAWVDSIADLVPGCSLATFDLRAQESGTYARGTRDLDGDLPFVPSTIALIDSVTKQFTTTMLAQAVAGGLGRDGPMTLATPIKQYVEPYLDAYGLFVPDKTGAITLQQLADYTSGFYERPFNEGNPPDYTLEAFATWLSEVKKVGADKAGEGLALEPGSGYYYSDVACDLLGFILADQLTLPSSPGMPLFDPLVTKMLTGPDVLDMPETTIYPPASEAGRVAIGYLYDKAPPNPTFKKATKVNAPPEFGGGGGNLRSTAIDMVKFLHALVDPPAVNHLDRAVPLSSKVYFHGSPKTGLGWDPVHEGEATVFLKNGGGSAGCTAQLGYSPQTKRALFFVSNVGFASTDLKVAEEFITLLSQISPESSSTTTSTSADPSSAPATPVVGSPAYTG